jgi:predicted protein tyrosine phosphatase
MAGPPLRAAHGATSIKSSTTDAGGLDVIKVLFVCSRNRIRSLTAEHLFAKMPGLQVRSAGTEADARVRVNAGHIGWADLIVVMERRHRERLEQRFASELEKKRVECLDIPDDYEYMDEELVATLRTRIADHLDIETT